MLEHEIIYNSQMLLNLVQILKSPISVFATKMYSNNLTTSDIKQTISIIAWKYFNKFNIVIYSRTQLLIVQVCK